MIVDPDFCDHWKTRMLVGLLDNDEAAPVYVLRLWSHCQNRRQSTFDCLPAEALKALCRFPGHSNKLEASLVASGFVRRDGEALVVCGWERYNASLLASWANGARGGRPPVNPGENDGFGEEKPTGKPTGSREEKRREDKRGEEKAAAQVATSKPQAARSTAPKISWTASEGWSGITADDRREFLGAFPSAVLDQELAKATTWLKANPTKAGKRNWRLFLVRWLGRCQDNGGSRREPGNRPPAGPAPVDPAKRRYWRSDADRAMTDGEYAIWRREAARGGQAVALAQSLKVQE